MLKNLKIGISFLQALLISDTSYDLEKLDEEEAGETDDQSEEGDDDMEEDDEDSEEYGIPGCGLFKGGIQNQKGFWLKINCIQMKLPNFENWSNEELSNSTKI